MTAPSSLAAAALRYGKLWGRGHETFAPTLRRVLSVKGKNEHATKYLQGLVTSDLYSDPNPPRIVEESISHAPRGNTITSTTGSGGAAEEKKENDELQDPTFESVDVEFTSKMRSTCFLDQKGKILTDALLWNKTLFHHQQPSKNSNNETSSEEKSNKETEEIEYLIDIPTDSADLLLSHLKKYKLRRTKVNIQDVSDQYSIHNVYGTLNAKGTPPGFMAAIDPRHPSLGMRVLSYDTTATTAAATAPSSTTCTTHEERQEKFTEMMKNMFPLANGTYNVIRKFAGVAEGSEINGKTALECNQEFLNAISFQKGCYLGQELTARSQHVGTIRKRIMPIMIIDTNTEIPRPWLLAHKLQDIGLENLKSDDMLGLGIGSTVGTAGTGTTTSDNGTSSEKVDSPIPTPLPQMSAAGVGGIIAMMQGNITLPESSSPESSSAGAATTTEEEDKEQLSQEEIEQMEKRQADNAILLQELETIAVKGAKIVDQKDGKTIGTIFSSSAPGTSVLLAQMRLDRVGLLSSGKNEMKWSQTNKIIIGDSAKEYRYLPYMPLWWPNIDPVSGKEKQ